MKQFKFVLLLMLLPLLGGLVSNPACAQDTTNPDVEQIKEQARRFSQAYVDGDLQTLLDMYTDDGMAASGGQDFVHGRAALERLWTLPAGRTVLRHKTTAEVLRVDGDQAYDWGYFEGQAAQDGTPLDPFRGKYLIVWVRGDDGMWRMAADMWSGVPAEADTGS